jgi:hypothetical protein
VELRPGLKLKSAVCATEVIVVSTAGGDVELTCGGVDMVEPTGQAPDDAVALDGLTEGTLLGKRYADADGTVELLCTKPGDGSVGIGQTALGVKDAKPLPASD